MVSLSRYFKDKGYSLTSKQDVIRAYADAKVNYQATQDDVAKAAGISSRTLRSYVANEKQFYDECITEFEARKAGKDLKLSEADLNAFVDNIIRMGTNPNSVKEMQLFIEVFGIKTEDIRGIIDIKQKSLRGWLREAESLQFMDMEAVQKDLFTMDILYSQNEQTLGATSRAFDMNVGDPLTQYRLMYMGAVFMSLYNQTEYSVLLQELSTLMKLEQIKQGKHIPITQELRKQAEKEAGTYQAVSSTPDEFYKECQALGIDLSYKDVERLYNNPKPVAVFPDKEEVSRLKKEHEAELEGYLRANEELDKLIKGEIR